ncbi:MAG: DUF1805 domain-containing protein [Methanomicrobiales archaeon]|nr:DUF1805 domain-containing protein [Methanomicrobiales archaeon]
MEHPPLLMEEIVSIGEKRARGYAIPLGPVNLVAIVTKYGVLGCGAIDTAALERFGVPAVRVSGREGRLISTTRDLLEGVVSGVNKDAAAKGIRTGMSGMDAAMHLL